MKTLTCLFAAFVMLEVAAAAPVAKLDEKITAGRLDAIGPKGQALGRCPLKHTTVEAELSGTVARVSVTQQFQNPFREKIEAIYVFPLHQDSAVDDMTMTVGERVVKGVIKERGEAKRIYDNAKAQGKVASLLDQERPNIFSQAVANIEPGQQVTITISYSQTLAWEDGRFGFDFPSVVGPRYIPGASRAAPVKRKPSPQRGPQGEPPVVNPDPEPATAQVPDAGNITPPVVEEGYRAGHDLAITVRIQAGLPITDLKSALHEVKVVHPDGDPARAVVSLVDKGVLPNRDFSISYSSAGEQISDALLTHTDERGKFFSLVLQPPARVEAEAVVPRELVFVLDTSGSMSGFPIETSKTLMRRAIEKLRPADRFNLVTFSGRAAVLFPNPVENTEKNRHLALGFIDSLRGSGGTEMMTAINTALGGEHDPKTVRIVCFLTDGYVGNDLAIIAAVRKHAGTTRVFSFGIGNSVNRFLLDSMARVGRGEVTYVLTHEEAQKSADKFYQRIDAPVLTDIVLDFGDLAVEEVFPQSIEDLFAVKPVVVKGRYTKAGSGVIKLKGRNAAGSFERDLAVTFPEENPENPVLAAQWARAKVGHLMLQDMDGMQQGQMLPALKKDIIGLGISYNLLTQFTSFVAVEEQHITEGGQPRTVQVPVEMPQGVSYSGVFGTLNAASDAEAPGIGRGSGPGAGFGSGSGSGSGKLFGTIPQAMSRRGSRADLSARLANAGGTPACGVAVEKVLDWLKQHQNKDGSWCQSHQTAMTGMALLTYLGHCETPASEKYGESVLSAIGFLVETSAKNHGKLGSDLTDTDWPYEHAVATFALADAYNFCKEIALDVPGLEEAVHNASQWIIDSQAKDGSWHYPDAHTGKAALNALNADNQLGCMNLQALRACSYTGIKFQDRAPCITKALAFIKTCQAANGAIGLAAKADATHASSCTGAGALAYQIWGGADALPLKACGYLANQAKFQWSAADADLLALRFNAASMLNCGGKKWSDFNAMFMPEVLNAQNDDGSFKDIGAGTDDPFRPLAQQFQGNGEAAVHYRSCLAALTLEVYYRFLSGAR